MSYDNYGHQDYQDPEHCMPLIHRWRPVMTDGPLDLRHLAGLRCYCGLRMLMVHACECGNEHLREVQVGSVKIEGGAHGQAT